MQNSEGDISRGRRKKGKWGEYLAIFQSPRNLEVIPSAGFCDALGPYNLTESTDSDGPYTFGIHCSVVVGQWYKQNLSIGKNRDSLRTP